MAEHIGYKYRSFKNTNHTSALYENYIWASRIVDLNDPYECNSDFLIDEELEILKRVFSIQDNQNAKIRGAVCALRNLVDTTGVFSMSIDPISPVMWGHYADSGYGFCVGYDIDLLKKYHSAPLNVHERTVDYSARKPFLSITDILDNKDIVSKLFATKSKCWEEEKEVRLIFDGPGKKEYPWQAVKEVLFGLKAKESDREKLIQSLEGYDVCFYQVEKGIKYGALESRLICSTRKPFKYDYLKYEILLEMHLPAVENYFIYIEEPNLSKALLEDFSLEFRKRFAILPANINLFSQKIPISLLEKSNKSQEESALLNSASLGSVFIGTDNLLMWPY